MAGEKNGVILENQSQIPFRVVKPSETNIISQTAQNLIKGPVINPIIRSTNPYAGEIMGPGSQGGILMTTSFRLNNTGEGAELKNYFIGYPKTITGTAFNVVMNDPDEGPISPAQWNAQFLSQKASVSSFNYEVTTSVSQYRQKFNATTVTLNNVIQSYPLKDQISKARSAAALNSKLINVVCTSIQPELSAARGLWIQVLANEDVNLDVDYGFFQGQ